ncbi:MAG: TIGR03960 family B12-binding radical SAM protein [Candidatus Omnitrophota bacterium]|nr:MAG: TIGR03960 family B12-binding radical SAM protein [Candidatus Omnitrophota bacterium]
MDFTLVQKPQRYAGNEWNVIKKPHHEKIRICIAYPDLYEVGMSNLGIRIIYALLNQFSDVVCERVFAPGADFAKLLASKHKKLTSLETRTPLDAFDVVGFNFNYELNYVRFLQILSLGGIPLRAQERKHHIVIGGGVSNPEPLAEFVDIFYLGEFEEGAQHFVDALRCYRDKESRLKFLSEIDGFYVPRFYSVRFQNNRYSFEKVYQYAQLPIRRVFVKDLNQSFYPVRWLVPHTAIVHDRAQIEIARGCPNRCTFCQARSLYHPYRQKKVSSIMKLIKSIYERSGYENLSFLALSGSDYSSLGELIDEALEYCQERRIGISLPSLRITDFVGTLYKKLIPLKKTSLTIAVEAADEPLRCTLNKQIDIRALFEAAKILYSLKIKHIKIYFMFGFHQENEENLINIGAFLKKVHAESKLRVHASINAFIPKPFSLWEDYPMHDELLLRKKRSIILKHISHLSPVKISISDPRKSILEAVISRGDRKLCSVIYRAFSQGVHFYEHAGHHWWKIWENSMHEENIDYRFYLAAETDNFPWSFINVDPRPKT